MRDTSKVLHTARTRTTGGRQHGISRSMDGYLDVRLAAPDTDSIGTSPEHLFAAAWSACFEHAIGLAAEQRNIALPAGITIDAEVSMNVAGRGHFLSAFLNVSLPGVERSVAEALIDEAHRTCPYSKATRGNIEVTIALAG